MATSNSVDEAFRQFTTTVAFITTHGSRGPNVMAAEWTFNVSYEPFLISVHIASGEATYEAIEETKEFSVNPATEEQVAAMSFAGHFTRHETDKLSSDLFETYPATKIKVPLIKGCLLNAECRLIQQIPMGDHTAFVGEVVAFSSDSTRKPVVLHRGAHSLGPRIERRETIAVGVTPSTAPAGARVTVDGELMRSSSTEALVHVLLQTEAGQTLAESSTVPNGRWFSARLTIPALAAGTYLVVARNRDAEGRARLIVT